MLNTCILADDLVIDCKVADPRNATRYAPLPLPLLPPFLSLLLLAYHVHYVRHSLYTTFTTSFSCIFHHHAPVSIRFIHALLLAPFSPVNRYFQTPGNIFSTTSVNGVNYTTTACDTPVFCGTGLTTCAICQLSRMF